MFVSGQAIALTYLFTWGGEPEFYQKYHGAAVMLALGKGFVNPLDYKVPAIKDFLNLKAKALDPGKLPEEIPWEAPTAFQENHRYAMYLFGYWWRLFGISWDAVLPLQGLFFGLAIAAAYYLFRVGMGRALAFVASVIVALSPGFLYMVPHFRDFSMAPFVLAVLALVGWLLKAPLPPARTLGLSAVLGGVMGVGLGFRQDVLACVPICAVLLFFFLPGPLRSTWWLRPLAVVALVVSFGAPGYPILKAVHGRAADSFHHINQGLTRLFNQNLGLGGAPYDLGCMYRDEYTHSIVSSFAMYKTDATRELQAYVSPEYDRASRQYFVDQFLRHFPADFLLRWYASTVRILNYSAFALDSFVPLELENGLLQSQFAWRWRWLGPLAGWGTVLALAALFLISVRSLRLAVAAGMALIYFGGYVSLQFMLRHYFYLEVLFWWVLGFLIAQGLATVFWMLHPRHMQVLRRVVSAPVTWWSPPVKRALAFAVIGMLAVAAPVCVARVWQSAHMSVIYRQYAEATREPLETETAGNGVVLFKPKGFLDYEHFTPRERALQVQTGLLVVEVEPADDSFWLVFVYEATRPENNFSDQIRIPSKRAANTKRLRVFFPAYNAPAQYILGDRHFVGVRVSKAFAPCIKGLYRVPDFGQLPVMMNLTLADNWSEAPTYLTWQDEWRPLPVLAWEARKHNLLPNGDFEIWPDAASAPPGTAAPPRYSSIAREHRLTSRGLCAVRQSWSASDSQAGPLDHFCVVVEHPESGVEYEVFVHACNLSSGRYAVSAWQVIQRDDGTMSGVYLLNPQVFVVQARPGYHEYAGRFLVFQRNGLSSIALVTSAMDAPQPGDAVIWDDWCVSAVAER